MHRCLTRAHGLQRFLGGNAPVHDPDPVRTPVLRLDLLQKVRQRGLVAGVARHHLVGQRKPLRRHDQGNHHLHAVRTLVAAVTEPALVRERRIALKISRGQVVQQHVEASIEQGLPAIPQKREKRPLVLQQLVQAAVQRVSAHHPRRPTQQIPHGAVLVPVPMQPPLAARIDQWVTNQRLQHVQPARALTTRRQPRLPEPIQLQPLPQHPRQPARPPLTRTAQPQRLQLDPNHLAFQLRRLPVRRKQRHRLRTRRLAQHLYGTAPRRPLSIVDLAQIQHLPLHHATARVPAVLHHAPVTVLLAVLETSLGANEHGPIACLNHRVNQGARSALQPVPQIVNQQKQRVARPNPTNIRSYQPEISLSCRSRARWMRFELDGV